MASPHSTPRRRHSGVSTPVLSKAESGRSPATERRSKTNLRAVVGGIAAIAVVAGFVAVATVGTDGVRRMLSTWTGPVSANPTPPTCTTQPGDVSPNYVASDSASPEWVEPVHADSLNIVDDDSFTPYSLGFTFRFFCRDVTTVYVHDNGFVTLSPTTGRTGNPEHFDQPGETISPYHFDLQPNRYWGGGYVSATTSGTAPNRVATITWSDLPAYRGINTDEHDKISFQVRLFEGSNHIRFNYHDMDFVHAPLALNSGRKGIASLVPHTGSSGYPRADLVYSYFSPNLPSGKTVDFTPVSGAGAGTIPAPATPATPTCGTQYTVTPNLSGEWFEPITHWDAVGDDTHYEIDVPWAVSLFCESSNKLYVTDNGLISFNPLPGKNGAFPRWYGPTGPVEKSIAVFWMDMFEMNVGETGRLFVDITGDAGSRTLTVTWENASPYYTYANKASPNQALPLQTFQARFCESTGAIRFNYKTVTTTDLSDRQNLGIGDTAVVGLGGVEETDVMEKVVYQAMYSQHVVGGPHVQDGLSIDFVPTGQTACPFDDVCEGSQYDVAQTAVAMLPEGPKLAGVEDDSQIPFDLCFDFKFQCGCQGETVDRVWISTNGLVRAAGAHPIHTSTFNQGWRTSPPRNSFAVLWNDWAQWQQAGDNGCVHAQCITDGGSKVAVITWKNVEKYGDLTNPPVTFQMQLHEDGSVVYVYDTVAGNPATNASMVGIGGRVDSKSKVHTLPLSDGQSLTWTCNAATLGSAPASAPASSPASSPASAPASAPTG